MTEPWRDLPPPEERGSPERAVAAAVAAAPDKALSFMAFSGNGFASPPHYVAFMQGETPLTSKLLTPVLVDAGTAEVTNSRPLPGHEPGLNHADPAR